jgi:ubiquinone/menaquinone biosynthesis C-methylase UbiE
MPATHLFSGSVPANYDAYLGPYLFEPYAIDLVERLKNDECSSVLELACGTGRVTNHLVRVLKEDAHLVASDLSEDMLQVARKKVTDQRVEWKVVDAQMLPFEDGIFDHVVCQFGVMFFPDRSRAFNETFRVLKPGGKFIFNTWGPIEHNSQPAFIQQLVQDIFKDEAPDFLQKGPYSFYEKDAILQTVRDAGFSHIHIDDVYKTASFSNLEEYLSGFLDGSPLSAFIATRPAGTRELVRHHAKQRMKQEDNIETTMLAYVCTGSK